MSKKGRVVMKGFRPGARPRTNPILDNMLMRGAKATDHAVTAFAGGVAVDMRAYNARQTIDDLRPGSSKTVENLDRERFIHLLDYIEVSEAACRFMGGRFLHAVQMRRAMYRLLYIVGKKEVRPDDFRTIASGYDLATHYYEECPTELAFDALLVLAMRKDLRAKRITTYSSTIGDLNTVEDSLDVLIGRLQELRREHGNISARISPDGHLALPIKLQMSRVGKATPNKLVSRGGTEVVLLRSTQGAACTEG